MHVSHQNSSSVLRHFNLLVVQKCGNNIMYSIRKETKKEDNIYVDLDHVLHIIYTACDIYFLNGLG